MSKDQESGKMHESVSFTAEEMLLAFRHGREYTPLDDSDGDRDWSKVPKKNQPFWEWLAIHVK